MTDSNKEYAAALFSLAAESGQEQAVGQALEQMEAQLAAQPEYLQLLSSPRLPMKERLALLETAFGEAVPEYALSFLQLLCEKGKVQQFSVCMQEYAALCRAVDKVSVARIVSAVELTAPQRTALCQKLEKISGHRVEARYELNPEILGGVVIYLDDRVIDGSLKHQFTEIKEVIASEHQSC